MLIACYDLAYSPPTFDVVAFLLHAEVERRRRQEQQMKILLLPGPVGGFRRDMLWPHDIKTREALLNAVVIPMCEMLPSCASIERVTEPDPAILKENPIGVGRALYGLAIYVKALRASGRPLRAREKRRNDRLVTITLRECTHWHERNSRLPEWISAAREIADLGYEVTFVRDTARASEPIDVFPVNAEAAIELHKRADLYCSAFCNLFVSNGPAWLAIALDAPVVMLKPTVEGVGRCYSASYFAECGIPEGGQIPGAGAHQRLWWGDDKRDSIMAAFRNFAAQKQLAEAV